MSDLPPTRIGPQSTDRIARFDELCRGDGPVDVWKFLAAEGDVEPQQVMEILCHDQHHCWQRGDRRLVESYFERRPDLRKFSPLALDFIYCEVLLREAHGQSPTVEEYVRRFPQFEVELTRQFAVHVALEDFAAPTAPSISNTDPEKTRIAPRRPPVPLEVPKPGLPVIPGFEILNELGRGGMGVVYRARQISPERLVAIKLIRRDWMESQAFDAQSSALGRFNTEAQAAARLEHDNIVPIYQLGRCDNQPFYVMRYVEGESLSALLRGGPVTNREAASLLEQVARAVQAAHNQGILHRDLKPHNILVDKATRRPLVTDFGLAKFVQQPDGHTRTGEVLGTPAYMSPEQARDASRAGAPSDIYALGATLFHMLTGRPPFQAAHLVETLRQIAEVEPVSPRRLNPDIDLDLETICLKCLQKEPARRYASAGLLADDLQAYFEGRSILARPVGVAGRTWLWCRRNPWLAALGAALVVSLVVALFSLSWGYYTATTSLAESQSSLKRALQVVDEFCTQVSEDDLREVPGLQPVRRDLLERALRHYQWFLNRYRNDPAIRDELAAAHYRIGRITAEIGSQDEALAAYREAYRLQKLLAAETPANLDFLRASGETVNAAASLLHQMGRFDEAAEMYAEATRLRQQAVDIDPNDAELQRFRANTMMNTGLLEIDRGRFDAASQRISDAQAVRTKLLATDKDNRKARRDLGIGHFSAGRLALLRERDDEAQPAFSRAAELFEELRETDRGGLSNDYRLAVCYRVLGDLSAKTEDSAKTQRFYRHARERIETLAQANPAVVEFQGEWANLLMVEGAACEDRGEVTAARDAFTKSFTVLSGLMRSNPDGGAMQRDLAVVLRRLALLDAAAGDRDKAREQLNSARTLLEKLAGVAPDDADVKTQLEETMTALRELEDAPLRPNDDPPRESKSPTD